MLSFVSLHLLSLSAGILAWVLGAWAVTSKKQRKAYGLSVASLSLCVIALLAQLMELGRLVLKEDLSAVMDTINAVNFAAIVLVVVTLVLNVAAVLRGRWERE